MGIWAWPSLGETMRAAVARATSRWSGMAKSRTSTGGTAPPQGLMRPARSSISTVWFLRARSVAAVAPAGPPPITTTSNVSKSDIAASYPGVGENAGTVAGMLRVPVANTPTASRAAIRNKAAWPMKTAA